MERIDRFQATLVGFEPGTDTQKLLHGETLRAYTGLPMVTWAVIVVGAFIGLSASFFFKVEDARLH